MSSLPEDSVNPSRNDAVSNARLPSHGIARNTSLTLLFAIRLEQSPVIVAADYANSETQSPWFLPHKPSCSR
jgi:hypothetical protein